LLEEQVLYHQEIEDSINPVKRQGLFSHYIKDLNESPIYREAWFNNGKLYFHEGKIGQKGILKTSDVPLQLAYKVIESFNNQAIRDNFVAMTSEHLKSLVIRFTVDGFGTSPQLAIRHELEDIIDEALGWTGNGRCNGGDAGSGTQQLDCQVLLVEPAIRTLTPILQSKSNSFEKIEIATDDRTVIVSKLKKR